MTGQMSSPGVIARWWKRLRCPHRDTVNAGFPGVWDCRVCGKRITAPGPR